MMTDKLKMSKEIDDFLASLVNEQNAYEMNLSKNKRKKNGIFLTNSFSTIEEILNVVDINGDILQKRILEPACGQGIFLLKLLSSVYLSFPNREVIAKFISENIYFVDIQSEMVESTKNNINKLFAFLFDENYTGVYNGLVADFTEKKSINEVRLFDDTPNFALAHLYNTFDYVIGNPPYVSLYGRRDKKESENQRVKYLQNYAQFPSTVKNGKINLVMLFLEHSLDLLKENGKISFIIDVAFFETAYQYTRKYLLEHSLINEIHINITDFDVASGQIILKLTKSSLVDNEVKIVDNKTKKIYYIPQKDWYNKDDEYKFRYNGCYVFKQICDKIEQKSDKKISQLFPNKNLRTCVMLLNMEDKFTFNNMEGLDENNIYPYYQGSKSLSQKFGDLSFSKYFYYDKHLQDSINNDLKIKLQEQGIKNKKRIGLGETVIYNNPKLYIRQSAKEIIASIDTERSAANNSLYVFSLRDNSQKTMDFLYFLCGFLNSDFVTYYAQQMNIIRFSEGKQPQIKIGDLCTIFIPQDHNLQCKISNLCKSIYSDKGNINSCMAEINSLVYQYYGLNDLEVKTIEQKIKDF